MVIRAPLETVFQATADLLRWPSVLPHYRWIRVMETNEDGLIVQMAARRAGLPIRWTSRFRVDATARELHFQHLKALTRGMHVVWTYTPAAEGVEVRISHKLERTSAVGRWFANCVLGKMFITPVATLTLTRFKEYLEQKGT